MKCLDILFHLFKSLHLFFLFFSLSFSCQIKATIYEETRYKIKNLVLGHVEFEIFERHLCEYVKKPLEYVGLEFRSKFWAGDENFGVLTTEVAF